MSEPACKSVYDMSSKYTETPSQSSIQHGLVMCVYCLLDLFTLTLKHYTCAFFLLSDFNKRGEKTFVMSVRTTQPKIVL